MRMLLPALTLALAGTAAQAADNGFYLGAAVSQAEVDDIFGSRDLKLDNTAWKIMAGFRPLDLLALEVDYMDLGSESRSFGGGLASARADAKAFAGYAIGFLPLPVPFLDVYGKAGVARWDLQGDSDPDLVRFDDKGTEFAWGAGAQVHFGSLAARLEYENFDIRNTDGVDLYSLGVTWTFL